MSSEDEELRAAIKTALALIAPDGGMDMPFGPKQADHPSTGNECPACHEPMAAGEFTTLVSLGPGRDPEEQIRMLQGRPYNAVAVEVHYECKYGITPLEMVNVAARQVEAEQR